MSEINENENIDSPELDTPGQTPVTQPEEISRPTNERLDLIMQRISEIQDDLLEIRKDLPRPEEEAWKRSSSELSGNRLRNSRGEYTSMGKEHEEALKMNKEKDDAEKTPDTPEYSPEESGYSPSDYSPEAPSYTPDYSPTDDPELATYTPGVSEYTPSPEITDWRKEALVALNELAIRDQKRAIERYGGFRPFAAASGLLRMTNGLTRWLSRGKIDIKSMDRAAENIERTDQKISSGVVGRTIGKMRAWFDRIGSRTILTDQEIDNDDLDENLVKVANFQKTPGWRKALKIGAKFMGGFGVAGAMIMTGGIGAPTALLWAGGMKEGFDSIGQTVEQIGWGRRRAALELESQSKETDKINQLKSLVAERGTPLTLEEFNRLVNQVLGSETDLTEQEAKNITGEKKGQIIRSLSTSAATIGVGLFAGVPLGRVNYDTDNTALAISARAAAGTPGVPIMNETHRAFWNVLNGGQFGYEHNSLLSAVKDSINGSTSSGAEFGKMTEIINHLNNTLHGNFGTFTLTPASVYGQTAHILGGALPLADQLKLAAVPAYLAAETLRHFAKKSEGPESPDYAPNYTPNAPDYSHYSPEYSGGSNHPESGHLEPITDPDMERRVETEYMRKKG